MTSETQQERRHSRRAHISSHGRAAIAGQSVEIVTRDVSLGGSKVVCACDQAPEVNQELDLRLDGPGFAARARVCWRQTISRSLCLVGLEFLKFDFAPDPEYA